MTDSPAEVRNGEAGARRVSWVELYFDLVFVFAVGQAAHTAVADPTWHGVGVMFGLFVTLWWTWIGFVLLYNRHGEDSPGRRLVVLAGTVPCAIAAVEAHDAYTGRTASFALALATTRLLLAFAFAYVSERTPDSRPVALGYLASALLLGVSAAVPAPWRYVLWGVALAQEAGMLLLGGIAGRTHGFLARLVPLRRPPTEATHPGDTTSRPEPVNAEHLAERFGLFVIILLGEIVISVGGSAIGAGHRGVHYWIGLCGGLVMAAALWWVYFTSAAGIDENVLLRSGGNPATAYALYAGGHLIPASALLAVAAGFSLGIGDDPPRASGWLIAAGLTGFVFGTRAVAIRATTLRAWAGRLVVAAGTVCLALLQPLITTTGVLVLATACAVVAALYVSSRDSAGPGGRGRTG